MQLSLRTAKWATFALSLLIAWPATPQSRATIASIQRLLPSARSPRPAGPIKCGLADIAYLRQNFPKLDAVQRQALGGLLDRPSLPESYVSAKGHFKIHYTTSGIHAIDPTSTNEDGIPDYAYEAAVAAEKAYSILIDSMGFKPHPTDGIDGPECDIYLVDMESVPPFEAYYGATTSESRSGTGYTAYMAVENDFTEGFFTQGLDALRITIAHEFFHVLHFGYIFRNEDVFFYEMSSTWFEDEAYDDINDYFQYIPDFFRNFQLPLHTSNGWHEYGAALFLKYWLRENGRESLRSMWGNAVQEQALFAIADEIQSQGSSFAQALAEFASWCLYTGARARPEIYFGDGPSYPTVRYRLERSIASDTTIADSVRALGIRFYRISTSPIKDFSAVALGSSVALGVAGAPETLAGKLGPAVIGTSAIPIMIEATENEGTVDVAVVNGELPDNATTQPFLLPYTRYGLSLKLTAIQETEAGLLAPRPNPFVASRHKKLTILYSLSQLDDVNLSVVSEAGSVIFEQNLGRKAAGVRQFIWDGRMRGGAVVPSGIYLIVLHTASGLMSMKKVAILQ